jgi:multisubunit Na+/H+ antiporter MnhG subunit
MMTLMVLASASDTLGRQFAIVADITVVLFLLTYLAACAALLRFSATAPAKLRLISRGAAATGGVFCCAAIAASEAGLMIWTASAIALAGLAERNTFFR